MITTQNDLYEMVADFGAFLCIALRRDHYLARMVDQPETFLALADQIGDDRARLLQAFPEHATDIEFKTLIKKQIENALEQQHPDVTPALWLCEADNGQLTLIESWGEDINVELRFQIVGHYASRDDALDDLRRLYFTRPGDDEIIELPPLNR
jgi:hypothetical protein